MRRDRLEPHFSAKCKDPIEGWSCGLDPHRPPRRAATSSISAEQAAASQCHRRCRQRRLIPYLSLFKQDLPNPTIGGEGPHLETYIVHPNSEGPSRRRPRGARRTAARARRRSATAAPEQRRGRAKSVTGPAKRTFSTKTCIARRRRGTGTARRQGSRQPGKGGPDLGGRERHRGQRPPKTAASAELLVKVKAATGGNVATREATPRLDLQYALLVDMPVIG